jgi:hypothetical protein
LIPPAINGGFQPLVVACFSHNPSQEPSFSQIPSNLKQHFSQLANVYKLALALHYFRTVFSK